MQLDKRQIKYYLYARKSSEDEDRQVASIGAQIKELKLLAKEQGLKIVRIYSEAKSAKRPQKRPKFFEMLNMIKAGKADGILCWKLNRLARNSVDGGEIIWLLQEGIIKHIQTNGREYKPEDNVIMMYLEFAMANQFIKELSTDTLRGLKAKAELGWFPGKVPLGYLHNPLKKRKKDQRHILEDEEIFVIVQKMFKRVVVGDLSPLQVLELASNKWGLRNNNGKKIAVSTFYRMLTNTYYYGDYEYPKGSGLWYKGKHKPIITVDEYDRIQFLLGKKGKARPKKHNFAYTGLIRCGECGCMITAEEKDKHQKNGNTHHYVYYRCGRRKRNIKCKQKGIRIEKLEEQVTAVLEKIDIPNDFKLWVLDSLKIENQKETTDQKIILNNLQKQYNNCAAKISNLIDMRASGNITVEQFLEKKDEATKEQKYIQKLLADADDRLNNWLAKAEKIFSFAENAREKFINGDLQKKKEILASLGSHLILKNEKLSVSLKKPLVITEQMAVEVNAIKKAFVPLKNENNPDNITKLRVLYSQSSVLGGQRELNP